jgi:hypothetical protein
MPSYDDINALYQKYLGRAATQDEANNWASGQYGATDMAGIEAQIKGSGEAQTHTNWFAQNPPPPMTATGGGAAPAGSTLPAPGSWTQGGQPVPTLSSDEYNFAAAHDPANAQTQTINSGDLMSRIKKQLSDAGSTDDPNYWFQKISSDPNGAGSAWNYWVDRINRGEGAAGVRNGTVQRFQDSGGGTGGSGPLGTGGGAAPGTLTAYGVPTSPYQSQPWTGGNYTPPPVPGNLQTPYTPATWQGGDFNAPARDPALNTPYALRQWTGGQFTPPAISDALRTGNTFDPTATLPHFATGVQNFSGGPAVVGEQGPETVNLPPGSSVMPNAASRNAYLDEQQRTAGLFGDASDPTAAGAASQYRANAQAGVPGYYDDRAPAGAPAGATPGGPRTSSFDGQSSQASPATAPSGTTGNPWSSFYAPSQADLQNSPGFQSRLALDQQARERSAAARGSILSGGTQLELGRAAQDYASNEYNNLFNQSLATRGQNVNEQGQQFNQALAGQQQNFGQYATQAGLDLGARQQNFNEGQGSFNNALAAYNTNYNVFQGGVNNALAGRQQNENEYLTNQLQPSQYGYNNQYAQYLQGNANALNDYLTNYGIGRTGVQDFFNQNNAVANRGLLATTSGRPAGT